MEAEVVPGSRVPPDAEDEVVSFPLFGREAELGFGRGVIVGVKGVQQGRVRQGVGRAAEQGGQGLGDLQPAQGLGLEPADQLIDPAIARGSDRSRDIPEHRAADHLIDCRRLVGLLRGRWRRFGGKGRRERQDELLPAARAPHQLPVERSRGFQRLATVDALGRHFHGRSVRPGPVRVGSP